MKVFISFSYSNKIVTLSDFFSSQEFSIDPLSILNISRNFTGKNRIGILFLYLPLRIVSLGPKRRFFFSILAKV